MPERPAIHTRPIPRSAILLLLAFLAFAATASAEQGILVVHVTDPASRPLEGVQIGVKGAGALARTGSDGKARIVLAPETTAGSPITLTLGPQDAAPGEEWVFRSPDGGRTVVPSFENDSENYVPVVLETRRERDEIAAIVERLVASRTAEIRAENLQLEEQAKALTEAVRALATQRNQPDPPAGIGEALEQLAEGNTEAAEAIFRDVAERRTSESNEARLQAAEAWRHLGALAFLHDTDAALAAYHQAVALEPENAEGWNQLGQLLQRVGELEEAESAYRKVLEIGESSAERDLLAVAYGNLGVIYRIRGDLEEAESLHRQALALDEELGSKEGMASQYGNLGVIYQIRGDLEEAKSMHRQALALFGELGSKESMASAYGNLGLIYRIRGDLEEAESLLRQALALNEKLGRKEGMASAYGNLGLIYRIRGDLEEAESLHRQALALNEELGSKEGMALQYGNLGAICQLRGDLEEAESLHRQALAVSEEMGSKEGMALQYGNLGRIYYIRGDFEEARWFWERARQLFLEVGMSRQVEQVEGDLDSLEERDGE